jgi:voltage-gated potassium channel
MSTPSADIEPVSPADLDDPSGRLRAYLARTQTPLDLLALLTLWIVVVPPGDFGTADHASTIALLVRVALSVVYGIDITIRATLATHHWRYVRARPLSVLVVVFPPLRVIFSLRLVRSVFRRGNLERFLLAASILVLNGAIIVYLVERHAKGSNIHTLGQSVWWSMTTVTTVGYGDYAPVTTTGRVVASVIMGIGIVTLAVVTAQVSSSFVDQAARRRAMTAPVEPDPTAASMADISYRLARIEELLASPPTPPERATQGS